MCLFVYVCAHGDKTLVFLSYSLPYLFKDLTLNLELNDLEWLPASLANPVSASPVPGSQVQIPTPWFFLFLKYGARDSDSSPHTCTQMTCSIYLSEQSTQTPKLKI